MQNLAALAAIASNGNGIPSLGSGEFILLFFKFSLLLLLLLLDILNAYSCLLSNPLKYFEIALVRMFSLKTIFHMSLEKNLHIFFGKKKTILYFGVFFSLFFSISGVWCAMLLVVPDFSPSGYPTLFLYSPSPLPTPTCKKMMMMLRNQLSRTETSLCP